MKKIFVLGLAAFVAVGCGNSNGKGSGETVAEEIEDQDQFIEYCEEEEIDTEGWSECDPEKVIAFLQTVYPNKKNPATPAEEDVTTARFHRYSGIEVDYVPLYMTQEGFAIDMVPNVKISKYDGIEDAYKVEWDRYADNPEHVEIIVTVIEFQGKIMIDNIYHPMYGDEGQEYLFDYTKDPVPVYDLN